MILELARFVTIVERGSLTSAAKKLFLTQPALSQSVKRLEKEVGVLLFKQIGKRLVLTKDGEQIYEIGRKILTLWDHAKENKTPHTYAIGLFDNAALRLSSYFQKTLGKRKFEIIIDRSLPLLKSLHTGVLDICVCVIPEDTSFLTNSMLITSFFEKLVPVSGKVWKEPLSKIPFILYNKDSQTQRYIDAVFLKRNIKPQVIVESTNPAFMKELAIGNCGVTLLPENFIADEVKRKRLYVQEFPFQVKRTIGIFIQKNGTITSEDTLVKDLIENLYISTRV